MIYHCDFPARSSNASFPPLIQYVPQNEDRLLLFTDLCQKYIRSRLDQVHSICLDMMRILRLKQPYCCHSCYPVCRKILMRHSFTVLLRFMYSSKFITNEISLSLVSTNWKNIIIILYTSLNVCACCLPFENKILSLKNSRCPQPTNN